MATTSFRVTIAKHSWLDTRPSRSGNGHFSCGRGEGTPLLLALSLARTLGERCGIFDLGLLVEKFDIFLQLKIRRLARVRREGSDCIIVK